MKLADLHKSQVKHLRKFGKDSATAQDQEIKKISKAEDLNEFIQQEYKGKTTALINLLGSP